MSVRFRRQLVRDLELTGPVAEAFEAVPRELFVPEWARRVGLRKVYEPNAALVTQRDEHGRPTSSSSAPAIMAPMLTALAVEPGHRVLEIGTGTGYNAALLSHLVGRAGRVTSVELDPELAQRARVALAAIGARVRVVVGDGRLGWAKHAPYDRIIATASSPTVPRAWFDQLAVDALLQLPYQHVGIGVIPTLEKAADRLDTRSVLVGGFMGLRGSVEAAAVAHDQLAISDSRVGGPRFESLSGEAVRRLARAARQRLLHLLVDGPTDTAWRDADPTAFLLVGRRRAVQYGGHRGWGAGAVAADGSAAAVILRAPDGRHRLLRWGDDASDLLGEPLARWREIGRPTAEDLRLTVTFRGDEADIRYRWPRRPR